MKIEARELMRGIGRRATQNTPGFLRRALLKSAEEIANTSIDISYRFSPKQKRDDSKS